MALRQLLSELPCQPRMYRPPLERSPGQDASRSPRSPPLATFRRTNSGPWPAPPRVAGFCLSFRLFLLSAFYSLLSRSPHGSHHLVVIKPRSADTASAKGDRRPT